MNDGFDGSPASSVGLPSVTGIIHYVCYNLVSDYKSKSSIYNNMDVKHMNGL